MESSRLIADRYRVAEESDQATLRETTRTVTESVERALPTIGKER